jgi:hypothetical protein
LVITLRGWKPCEQCVKYPHMCRDSYDDDYGSYVPGKGCRGTKRVFWYAEYDFRLLWVNLAQAGYLERAFQEGYSAGLTDARQ